MSNQLNRLKIDYEFFPAVDGRKLTADQLEEMCDMKVVREWKELMTPGMIGCTLSHYYLYRRIVEERIDLALILEDDAKLSPDVTKIVSTAEALYKAGSLSVDEPTLLYFQSKLPVAFTNRNFIDVGDGYTMNYPVKIWQPLTTTAYITTYECAKRLVELLYPVKLSTDSWGVFYREGAIKGLRCVLPVPVQSGYFKSDIGYELNNPINNIVKWLESNNVFPIKQVLKKRRRLRAKKLNLYNITDSNLEWQ